MNKSKQVLYSQPIRTVLAITLVMAALPDLAFAHSSCPTISASGAGTYSYPSVVTIGGTALSTTGGSWHVEVSEASTPYCITATPLILPPNIPVALPDCAIDALGIGNHSISISLTKYRNTCTKIVEVEIIDDEAPTLAPEVNPSVLWPPNNKLVPVVVTPHAKDNSGAPLIVEASVETSEPVKIVGRAKKEKNKWNVPVYNNDGTITFNLPAQRLGKNKGRVYLITVTATDQSDNSSSATIEVNVPHDQRTKKRK